MGFTPLDGVPMATRAGSLDPGSLLYLLRHGVSLDELDHALEYESGLTGLAGAGDVASLEGDESPEARLALDVYCYRIGQAIASMATALGGLDALVFTGGVGSTQRESAPGLSATCSCRRRDRRAGQRRSRTSAQIGATSSRCRVHVIASREDVIVARAVRSLAV